MRHPGQRQAGQILDRLRGTLRSECAAEHMLTDGRDDLQVDQFRGDQFVAGQASTYPVAVGAVV